MKRPSVRTVNQNVVRLLHACADQRVWRYGVRTMPGDWTSRERERANRILMQTRTPDADWRNAYLEAAQIAARRGP